MNPFTPEGQALLINIYVTKLINQMRRQAMKEAWKAYQEGQKKIQELLKK